MKLGSEGDRLDCKWLCRLNINISIFKMRCGLREVKWYFQGHTEINKIYCLGPTLTLILLHIDLVRFGISERIPSIERDTGGGDWNGTVMKYFCGFETMNKSCISQPFSYFFPPSLENLVKQQSIFVVVVVSPVILQLVLKNKGQVENK